MSARGMALTVLVTQFVEAYTKDEAPEVGGFDISGGMIGPNVSAWLRQVAAAAVPPAAPPLPPLAWTDVTTRRQGETDRTPRVWEASAGRMRLTVHRHKDYSPDVWLFTCNPWFDCRELPSKAAPIAKQQAVALLRETLRAALQELGE